VKINNKKERLEPFFFLYLYLTSIHAFSFKPLRKGDGPSRAIFQQKNTRGLKEKRKKIKKNRKNIIKMF
jgi:hypothetical protein